MSSITIRVIQAHPRTSKLDSLSIFANLVNQLDQNNPVLYNTNCSEALIFLEHNLSNYVMSRQILQKSPKFSAKNHSNQKKNC